MRKFVLTSCITLLFVIYIVYSRSNLSTSTTNQVASLPVSSSNASTTQPAPTGQPAASGNSAKPAGSTPPANSNSPSPASNPAPQPAPQTAGQFKDGTYTGSVADAYFGNLQVQAVVSGGKLTDVVFLQYPKDRHTSDEINQQAMPQLKQEAITAQSANVNIISGATQTSTAFQQSLGSALSQAKS